jgi:predicted CoA-binding protein
MNTPITSTIQKPFSTLDRQVGRHPLDSIFLPKSVAVVGATEKVGSVGRTVLWNLMNTPFGGPIYPVNPTRPSVLGIKAYPKLAALPEKPDLVVVTTPAAIIPGIIGEAADIGIPGAVVIYRPARPPAKTASTSRAALRQSAKRCWRASSTSSGSTSPPFCSGPARGSSTASPSSISSLPKSSIPLSRRTSATAERAEMQTPEPLGTSRDCCHPGSA